MSSDADTASGLSPDLVFEILSNTRRRMLLYYLRRHGGSATVKELAEQIAALENEVDVEDLQRQQRKRVYVSLYQTHVPKLEEAGIVEYDDASGEVRLTNRADEFDDYLTPTAEPRYPWRIHYLVLAAVGGWLFVLSLAGIPVVSAIPTAVIGVALVVAFAASAAVQYWRYKQRQQEIPRELLNHDE
jgi:DNA-binding transcriptional ArsR family regulator